MRPVVLALACALTLLAGACSSEPAAPTVPEVPSIEETEFHPSLGVDLAAMTQTASGLYYRDLAPGSGDPARAGQEVQVHYTGWLPDGTRFDSNLPGQDPLEFVLGAGQVIPGFEQGVTGMRVGGQRQLVIPPALGYGATPRGSIPANSILVFVVELVGIDAA